MTRMGPGKWMVFTRDANAVSLALRRLRCNHNNKLELRISLPSRTSESDLKCERLAPRAAMSIRGASGPLCGGGVVPLSLIT